MTFKDVDGVTRKRFEIVDKAKAVNTLRDEVLSREVSDNISDALQGFFEGKAVLEATPAYQQIRNILYSIADKNIISPKVNGGLKVQIPQSLFESGNVKVEEVNGKMAYTSDTLKFYEDEDGKRYCEIMVGRWFESPLSDDELMDYFNNTEEGKKQLDALAGVAFRIPTQKQNSIDAFRIKKFLPREFRDSVVVPLPFFEAGNIGEGDGDSGEFLVTAACVALSVAGFGFFVSVVPKGPGGSLRWTLLLLTAALWCKFAMASVMLKPHLAPDWVTEGRVVGLAAGLLAFVPLRGLRRAGRIYLAIVLTLAGALFGKIFGAYSALGDFLRLFSWPHGQLATFATLTRWIHEAWPVLALAWLIALFVWRRDEPIQ